MNSKKQLSLIDASIADQERIRAAAAREIETIRARIVADQVKLEQLGRNGAAAEREVASLNWDRKSVRAAVILDELPSVMDRRAKAITAAIADTTRRLGPVQKDLAALRVKRAAIVEPSTAGIASASDPAAETERVARERQEVSRKRQQLDERIALLEDAVSQIRATGVAAEDEGGREFSDVMGELRRIEADAQRALAADEGWRLGAWPEPPEGLEDRLSHVLGGKVRLFRVTAPAGLREGERRRSWTGDGSGYEDQVVRGGRWERETGRHVTHQVLSPGA